MAARARVHVVTGKGGVGKTSVAVALGRDVAARGGRALVLDLAPGLGLGAALEIVPSHDPAALGGGLDVAATDPVRAVDDLVLSLSPSRRAAARLLRVASLRAFLAAAPGVLEVALLYRIDALAGSGRWDAVVVDADSSGHVRMLLDAPDLLRTVGAAGPVRRALDSASALFRDPERASVHVVTLPTTLALEETVELVDALGLRGVMLDTLFVSRAPAAPTVDADAAAALAARARGTPAGEDIAALSSLLDARARLDRFEASERPRFRRVVELAAGSGDAADRVRSGEVLP